ncbi:MAG: VWA domain-containing protein, partial [Planctomycetota bacterium]
MNFAAPLAFATAALALPIIVLYILKVKRRRVSVPYLRLWEELLVETRARSLFQRLKRFYSLLLQLLILAALAFALTQPAFELASVKKESVVLLLDTSASMNALEGEDRQASRFELMLERAAEIVEGRSFEDEMMVVAVSDRVDVLCSFNRSTIQLRAALQRVLPSKRSLDAERAYAFAKDVTSGREHPVILFLTDGSAGAVERLTAGDDTADLLVIGEATENVGIVRFSARKNTSLGTDYVLGVVKNFGEQEVQFRYELSIASKGVTKTTEVKDVTLGPGQEWKENWQFDLAAGGTLRLAIEAEGDRLAVDDEAWAVVRPTRLRKVVLVAPDMGHANPFKVAFLSMGEVISADTFVTTTAVYSTLDEDTRRADVTIIVDALPSVLPDRGNVILMNTPLPDFLPATIRGVDPSPTVWDWDREHLLNRYLNYRDLPIPAAKILDLSGGEALVETFEGPLIAAFDLPDRRLVYVAFDMLAELFPFRLAFPMLLRNSIAWFEVEEDVVIEANYAPGSVIQPLRRVGADNVHVAFLRASQRVTRTLDVREGLFYFGETDQPGIYEVTVAGMPHPTTVNLFDPGESAISPNLDEAADESLSAETGRH